LELLVPSATRAQWVDRILVSDVAKT
jgi:hypothetical protein